MGDRMSAVVQLSVRISNEAGSVSDVTRVLGEAGVDIRGFSVSDTADHGVLRLIVDDTDRACESLKRAGMTACETPVLLIALPDQPGGLAGVLKIVSEAGVKIEYVYSLISTYVVLNVASPEIAVELMAGKPVHLVSREELAAQRAS
jgi:hypothetical protein